jgi:hypothetical protein
LQDQPAKSAKKSIDSDQDPTLRASRILSNHMKTDEISAAGKPEIEKNLISILQEKKGITDEVAYQHAVARYLDSIDFDKSHQELDFESILLHGI